MIRAETDRAVHKFWVGPVRIEGFCNSACLMFTTLPSACLAPRLKLGFHEANVNLGFVGNPEITKYLRGGIQKRFVDEWQNIQFTEIHCITTDDFIELDPTTKALPRLKRTAKNTRIRLSNCGMP